MGQWLSCAVFFAPSPSAAASAFSFSQSSIPSKDTPHSHKTPSAPKAINRRAAATLGTESTLVDSATQHSTTTFTQSTTQNHDSSLLSISPPPHHRRYLSSAPFSASASASPPAASDVSSPQPQYGHVRSSSASSSLVGCGSDGSVGGSDAYPVFANMTRTSSQVDDIIEEVIEPAPASTPSYTSTVTHQPRSLLKPSEEQEDVEESEGEARSARLVPLQPSTRQLLSPRSVLAFMIVSNGGDSDTADEASWDDEVEEMDDDDSENEDELAVDGVSMRDMLASLPTTSTTFISPFPSAAMPSYSSLPSLPSASSFRPTTRHTTHTNSLSYPSLTALVASHNTPTRSSRQRKYSIANDEATGGGVWYDGESLVVPTRPTRSTQQQQYSSVVAGC